MYIAGRTKHLSHFVKSGTPDDQPSFVEVDLYETADKYITIRRVLHGHSNSSVWYLNGIQKKMSDVKAVVRALAIDVDNLCSFMPQDRVGAFSQYNGKEILQNTLKSIRSPLDDQNLFEEQTALSNLEAERELQRRNRDSIQAKLDLTRRELDSLQSELSRLERRKEAIEKLKLLKLKLVFVQAQNAKQQFDERTVELHAAEEELTARKLKLKPLEQAVARYQKALDRLRASTSRAGGGKAASNVAETSKALVDGLAMAKGDISNADGRAEEASLEIGVIEAQRAQTQARLDRVEREIASLSAQLQKVEAELPELEASQRENTEHIATNTRRMTELEDQRETVKRALQEMQEKEHQQRARLDNLRDARQVYRQKLAAQTQNQAAQNVVRVMDYLDNNMPRWREQGRLRGEVHGPVGMLIAVQDPAYASMVEKLVGPVRAYSFLTENEDDFRFIRDTFATTLRVHVNTYNIENLSVLSQPRIYQAAQLERFRSFGVVGYLGDQCQCPDIVRAFLSSFAGLHTTLCGKSDVDRVGGAEFAQLCANPTNNFRMMLQCTEATARRQSGGQAQFAGVIVDYNGRKSRYSREGAPSISTSTVPPGRGLVTGYGAGVDSDIQAQRRVLEDELRATQGQQQRCQEQLQQLLEAHRQCDTDRRVLLRLRADFTTKRNEPAGLKHRLQEAQRTQQQIERQLSGDVEKQKQQRRRDYAVAMEALLESLGKSLAAADRALQHLPVKSVSAMKRAALEDMQSRSQQALDDAREALVGLTRCVEKLRGVCAQLQQKFARKEQELDALAAAEGDLAHFTDVVFPRAEQVCATSDEAEIEQLIIETDAAVNSIVDNPGLLQRQLALQAQLADYTQQLEGFASEHAQTEQSLQARKDAWLTSVRALKEKLHQSFQTNMRELLFDGEVELREQGSFTDYELVLLVKFRKEAPLSALSAQKHSGGERAVSTIMFLMALQEMTQSPFRVVDEINQGMDERNERLVVDRIVRNCCGDSAVGGGAAAAALWRPQYFLITPKLLPNLVSLRHPDVTVLLVRSGAGLRDAQWSFAAVVAQYLASIKAQPLPDRPRIAIAAPPTPVARVAPPPAPSSSSSGRPASSGAASSGAAAVRSIAMQLAAAAGRPPDARGGARASAAPVKAEPAVDASDRSRGAKRKATEIVVKAERLAAAAAVKPEPRAATRRGAKTAPAAAAAADDVEVIDLCANDENEEASVANQKRPRLAAVKAEPVLVGGGPAAGSRGRRRGTPSPASLVDVIDLT